MMSGSTLSLTHRTVTLAGLLAFASLALPTVAQAQTIGAERALLNKTDAPFGASVAKYARVIDGARALLSRPGAGDPQVFHAVGATRFAVVGAYGVDGRRALLGYSLESKAANCAVRNGAVRSAERKGACKRLGRKRRAQPEPLTTGTIVEF